MKELYKGELMLLGVLLLLNKFFSWIFLLLFGTKLFVVVGVVVKFPIVCVNAWFKLKILNEKRYPI